MSRKILSTWVGRMMIILTGVQGLGNEVLREDNGILGGDRIEISSQDILSITFKKKHKTKTKNQEQQNHKPVLRRILEDCYWLTLSIHGFRATVQLNVSVTKFE